MSQISDQPEPQNTSFGLVPLPAGTFEHDVAIGDRYQKFSGELLRLSLGGIGAIGVLVISSPSPLVDWMADKLGSYMVFTLSLFGISSALSLLHLYVGSDSKAYHLNYLRYEKKLGGNERIKELPTRTGFIECLDLYTGNAAVKNDDIFARAAVERDVRNFLLKLSRKLLFWSSFCLWAGAMSLGFIILKLLYR